jgi:putative peptidoglycan lipid II flippase
MNSLLRLAIAGVIAAVPTLIVLLVMQKIWGEGKWASVAELVVGAVVLVAVYGGAALMLRVREVRDLVGMVRGRLGR